MKVETYEAIVENGQIKLSDRVRLPENARVYVVVPNGAEAMTFHVGSPRLAQSKDAADFVKEIAAMWGRPDAHSTRQPRPSACARFAAG